ncbi:helix-turn-helix domain-containing protein [Streptomyces sioyaensis]|uniref:helix-turn-helix domain-containing protein n=1 Tax=Streptomyces sioyaensis TaxID=67364 RepID=UPI003D7424C1
MTPNGSAIRAIREAQKLSLRALSDRTGLNRGYLSRLERGQIRATAEHRVEAIAEAMRVPREAITHKETHRDDDGHEKEAPHRPRGGSAASRQRP